MIWRWLICFSACLINGFAVSAEAATISGSVVLRDSRVVAVSRGKDFSGVIVSAVPMHAPAASLSDARALSTAHATMMQKGKMFMPHILPVQAGTTVDFPNFDPIFHSAFSIYSGQVFDLGLYAPGTTRSVRFTRPGVLRVFCNIHPAMSAVILVLNTPYFTKTAKDGSFQMNLPEGDYEFQVFHERATEQELANLTQPVAVSGAELRLAPIMISEAGYLIAPHKNKYGHDYPPPPDDGILYPGRKN